MIFVAHATGAVAWWWMMPGGFPLDHPRFWVNRVLPWVVLGTAVVGRLALRKRHERCYQSAAVACTVLWTAATIAGVLAFPRSAARFFPPVALLAFLLGLAYLLAFRGRLWARELAWIGILSAALGGALPWTQRAPEGDTRPSGDAPPHAADSLGDVDSPPLLSLNGTHRLATADGTVRTTFGGLTVDVEPLLTFESRSPDRCWTNLAPRDWQQPPRRRLTSLRHGDGLAALTYDDSIAQHWLSVASDTDGGTSIEATAQVAAPVFSHLNSFCNLIVRGHKRLALSFSPCEEARIEVLPSDYPVGQPRRLAYFADETLYVVEASSGEKGRFARSLPDRWRPTSRWRSRCTTRGCRSPASCWTIGRLNAAGSCRPRPVGACPSTPLSFRF